MEKYILGIGTLLSALLLAAVLLVMPKYVYEFNQRSVNLDYFYDKSALSMKKEISGSIKQAHINRLISSNGSR